MFLLDPFWFVKVISKGLEHAIHFLLEQSKNAQSIPISNLRFIPNADRLRNQNVRFIADPDGLKNQGSEGICYACATVTCIRCAQTRLGIKCSSNAGNYYQNQIVQRFGKQGEHLCNVLPWILPHLNLKFKRICSTKPNYEQAEKEQIQLIKKYLNKAIPVLIVVQWSDEPLTSSKKKVNLKKSCHAMVIVGLEGNYWKVQNSWGNSAHQGGIVKMHNQSYIREAYIVYGPKEDV